MRRLFESAKISAGQKKPRTRKRNAQVKLHSWPGGTDYVSHAVLALKAIKLRDFSLTCYGWYCGSETRCI